MATPTTPTAARPASPRAGGVPAPRRTNRQWLGSIARAIVLIVLIVGGAAAWWLGDARRSASEPGQLAASGTAEVDEVLVGPEVTGRLLVVAVEEGQAVRAGDVLARLDDSLIRVQFRQTDAASQQQLEIQAEKYVLRSPIAGVVTRLPALAGEVILPGQTVVMVADLSRLRVTLYVPESDLGQVRLGQAVRLTSDAFPGRTFLGTVSSINSRAEFTPRNVQTPRDRLNLVFGVKVRLLNPDGALKPGMSVDATFELPS